MSWCYIPLDIGLLQQMIWPVRRHNPVQMILASVLTALPYILVDIWQNHLKNAKNHHFLAQNVHIWLYFEAEKSITYELKKLLEVICLKCTRYVHFGPKIVIISIFSNYFDKCLPKTFCNAVRTEWQKKTPKTWLFTLCGTLFSWVGLQSSRYDI